ncbi:MAG: RagB/SusD family nutrient uptake outer membrane protein [Bacteroidales bacterium]|nr:RagB/SusD family nutrient uptake outer membrane protein [Bacteroidales bacterium]
MFFKKNKACRLFSSALWSGIGVGLLLVFASCDKMLDAPDKNAVEASDNYNTFNDADNLILGIYGKLMELVDEVVVLNELRGDLMDVTVNATSDQTAINDHNATPDNAYCDLSPFYEVILNCNDALANFDYMKSENKLSKDNYDFRYADVMTVRSWVYLQLAIHFGNIPYITEPFVTVEDLKDASRFPILSYEQVLEKLREAMQALPTLEVVVSSPIFAATSAQTQNVNLKMMLLNKHMVFGDILLYSNRYEEAAAQYYEVINEAEKKAWLNNGATLIYKAACDYDFYLSSQPFFYISYDRYKAQDIVSFGNKWKEIFSRASTDSQLGAEMINMFEYKSNFAIQYPLIELFANTGKGKYRLKPSQHAIDDLWEAQIQRGNNVQYDGRGRESSFDHVNGDPVVIKYLYDYYPRLSDGRMIRLDYASNKQENLLAGKWFIYRAGLLHLRYAEAANRSGYPDLALALLNSGGVRSAYNWSNFEGLPWGGSGSNVEGIQYSGYRPVDALTPSVPYPYPFYLDARFNSDINSFHQYTRFTSPWYRSNGLRYRVYLQNVAKPDWVLNKADSIQWVEEALLTEAALECGFEGHRWGDMLRIALRKNKDDGTGTIYLNEMLRKKFEKAGKAAPSITPNNWFLPRKN